MKSSNKFEIVVSLIAWVLCAIPVILAYMKLYGDGLTSQEIDCRLTSDYIYLIIISVVNVLFNLTGKENISQRIEKIKLFFIALFIGFMLVLFYYYLETKFETNGEMNVFCERWNLGIVCAFLVFIGIFSIINRYKKK